MSNEIDAAVGEAPARSDVVQLLNEKREALEAARKRYATAKTMRDEGGLASEGRLIDVLKTMILELEIELIGVREVKGQQNATARLLAIRRAYGSITSSMDADETRVDEKIAELVDAIARLNDRYEQVTGLRAEAMALSDRFDLPKPTLPTVLAPGRRDLAITLTRLPNTLRADADRYQPTEQCEHNVRTRRTYAEVPAGTPGARIIEEAGLKPFAEPTKRQQEIIAARKREKESDRRQFAGLPTIPPQGSVPLGSL